MGNINWRLGIEVARRVAARYFSIPTEAAPLISFRVCLLLYTCLRYSLGAKPVDTPIDPNAKLVAGQGELLKDPEKYRRAAWGSLIPSLSPGRPDISISERFVSKLKPASCTSHW
jgi:hypothetical protein